MTADRLAVLARRVAIVALTIGILLQPGFEGARAPEPSADVEILVVVDRTRSMAALDHQSGPRIYGVQRDLTAIAAAVPGARFGLVTYGSSVELELPFTSDLTTFRTAVETLRLEGPFDGSGSTADRPLETMREILARADEQHPERRRFLIFASDGENTTAEEQASFAELDALLDGGIVLGYGTDAGAKMPQSDDLSPDDGYVYDQERGEDAISSIDEGNLRSIAQELGVGYEHRADETGADRLASGFEARLDGSEEDAPVRGDVTWLLGLVLLALTLLELRRWWRAIWTSATALNARGGG